MSNTSPKNFIPRAPIVVVLGHVDHGKTSLLDYIKKSNVAAKESGGITQHIGAYEIECKGKKITFLDTPGHEAFSAMRSRGANAADIAILVVASDEGVKPQTKEAINVIKNSKIPFIVAINKIDREGAIPEKVKHELMKYDIIVESLGGEVASVNTSAKSGAGIDELLDLILLMGEINELKGHPEKSAEGLVIEAYLDKKRGPNATLLVLDGTLKVGDFVATKTAFGKIKILEDFQGDVMKKAAPSQPCLVIGFENVPGVGEEFSVFESAEKAQEYVAQNSSRRHGPKALDLKEGQKPLNLILKVDVAGSIEAIEKTLEQLPQEEIVLNILKADVGDITEKDIELAISANARILAFRVKAPAMIQRLAEDKKVRLAFFDIIYNLSQGVRAWQQELIKPKAVRVDYGRLRILAVFWTEGSRQIVGGRVTDGEIKKGLQLEVYRGDQMIGKGRNLSLQRNKKDIESASKRDEVAFLFEGDCRIQEDDTIVFYGIQS